MPTPPKSFKICNKWCRRAPNDIENNIVWELAFSLSSKFEFRTSPKIRILYFPIWVRIFAFVIDPTDASKLEIIMAEGDGKPPV